MKARALVLVLSTVCIFLALKLAARPSQQSQGNTTLTERPMVASDADIQLLRQDLRAQKQKLIAQNLPMTESEAVKFWNVYNHYTQDLREINDEKFLLIKQYRDSWGSMGDEDALIYIRRWLELDAQAHELRSRYVLDVSKALPGKKTATFFSARPTDQHDDGLADFFGNTAGPVAGQSVGTVLSRFGAPERG